MRRLRRRPLVYAGVMEMATTIASVAAVMMVDADVNVVDTDNEGAYQLFERSNNLVLI